MVSRHVLTVFQKNAATQKWSRCVWAPLGTIPTYSGPCLTHSDKNCLTHNQVQNTYRITALICYRISKVQNNIHGIQHHLECYIPHIPSVLPTVWSALVFFLQSCMELIGINPGICLKGKYLIEDCTMHFRSFFRFGSEIVRGVSKWGYN